MSQNAPMKKIQVAARQSKVADLYLKNISINRISEIFGVDRKTIQRDLQQIKFNFRRSVPNEVSYKIVRYVLFEHSLIFQQTMDCLNQAKTHKDGRGYLEILKRLWDSKTAFLEKIGIFEGIPEMLGKEHDLYEQTLNFTEKLAKDSAKRKKELDKATEQEKIEKDALLARLLNMPERKSKKKHNL